jgi:hypothetical protein
MKAAASTLRLLLAAGLLLAAVGGAHASQPLDACTDRCEAPRPVGARLVTTPPPVPVAQVPGRPATPATPATPRVGGKSTPARARTAPRAKDAMRHAPATPGMQMLLRLSNGSGADLS